MLLILQKYMKIYKIKRINILFFINNLKSNNLYKVNKHYINLKKISKSNEYIKNIEK